MGNRQRNMHRKSRKSPRKNASMATCEICTLIISLPNKMFKNKNKCAHPFCLKCTIKYIDTKLDQGMSKIVCPDLNCEHHLDPLSCRPIIPSHVFNKWCDLLCESAILGIDRCYCPYEECSVMILNECGGSVSKSQCPQCKKLFCYTCQVAWHAGFKCEEGKEPRDANDISFGVLAENKKWQRCPGCHHFVERICGCNVVECRCGTNFCYDCGEVLNRGCGCTRVLTRPRG